MNKRDIEIDMYGNPLNWLRSQLVEGKKPSTNKRIKQGSKRPHAKRTS